MGKDINILIRNAGVYDGTGGDPFTADIGIVGDRIAFVSSGRQEINAAKVIDAGGLSVAPGFIDAHAHSEFTLLADGRAEGKVLQGVTTEINGNCGLSAAPLFGSAKEHREEDIRELEIKERWSTFEEYFDFLGKKRHAINFATLVGHGNIRASVIGYVDRTPDEDEFERMCILLENAVSEGAIGLSTGLIYPPGIYAETEEIVGLARCISDLIYITHMRSEGDELIEAIEEALRIGRESRIAVHISHIKTGGKRNWHKIDHAVSIIEKARDEGMEVTCDRYPYTAGSTDLDAVLPSWVFAGGAEEELRRLKDEAVRSKIRDDVVSHYDDDEYWDAVTISSMPSESNKWMEGKTLLALSSIAGKKPVDFLLDILVGERLRIGAIFHSMNEDNLSRLLSLPYLMIGSDSSARSFDGPTHKGKPHPRGFGTFPRFLGKYAREMRRMSMSEAVHRATMLPAETFGLRERGRIKSGFMADLVIFDEKKVIDRATFEEPFLKPDGIYYVIVNGTPVVWEGLQTGRMAGRVLRHGK